MIEDAVLGWGTPGPQSSVTSLRSPSQSCSLESRPGDRHPALGLGNSWSPNLC